MRILAAIGLIVCIALLAAGLVLAGAFISWVWYWRFGKGARAIRDRQ